MIKIQLVCATCGKFEHGYHWLDRTDELPHWNLERDLKRIINQIGWIYQDDVVGDIYCSEKCAE